MKDTTKSIIELAISGDDEIDPQASALISKILNGEFPKIDAEPVPSSDEPLLFNMKCAAQKLWVSRATFWRLVNSGAIEPIEIFEGVFRYSFADLVKLARQRAKYQPKTRGTAKAA